MDRKCVVIEMTHEHLAAVFEKGFYQVEDPLGEARAFALNRAEEDPEGTYEVYVLDSEVIRRCEILEHSRSDDRCQAANQTPISES